MAWFNECMPTILKHNNKIAEPEIAKTPILALT
jgi:hypothetical protein